MKSQEKRVFCGASFPLSWGGIKSPSSSSSSKDTKGDSSVSEREANISEAAPASCFRGGSFSASSSIIQELAQARMALPFLHPQLQVDQETRAVRRRGCGQNGVLYQRPASPFFQVLGQVQAQVLHGLLLIHRSDQGASQAQSSRRTSIYNRGK